MDVDSVANLPNWIMTTVLIVVLNRRRTKLLQTKHSTCIVRHSVSFEGNAPSLVAISIVYD